MKNPHSLKKLKIVIEEEIDDNRLQHVYQEISSGSVRLALKAL
jgi:hypothetical protein